MTALRFSVLDAGRPPKVRLLTRPRNPPLILASASGRAGSSHRRAAHSPSTLLRTGVDTSYEREGGASVLEAIQEGDQFCVDLTGALLLGPGAAAVQKRCRQGGQGGVHYGRRS